MRTLHQLRAQAVYTATEPHSGVRSGTGTRRLLCDVARVQAFTSECVNKAETGEVARAKDMGEKEKECTTECKSQRRLDEMAPWALHYGSGEGGGDEKGRRRGGEECA